MELSEKLSKNAYTAAYEGLAIEFPHGGFDVVGWKEDEDAMPIISGSCPRGAFVIFQDCQKSDFGYFDINEVEIDDFVEVCMEYYGNVEVGD